MILDEIAAATRLRVEQLQRIKDLNKIRSDAESLPKNNRGFRTRLSRDGMNFITEVKKASPLKVLLAKSLTICDWPEIMKLQVQRRFRV